MAPRVSRAICATCGSASEITGRIRNGRRAAAPAAGRQPAEIDAEDQGQQRRHDEARDGDPDHRQAPSPHSPTQLFWRSAATMPASEARAAIASSTASPPTLKLAGAPSTSSSADGEVLGPVGRAEVAAQQAAEIAQVLLQQRLVEMVGLLDVAPDLRRQRPLLVERPARRQPHHEEAERDDDQQRRHADRQPRAGSGATSAAPTP